MLLLTRLSNEIPAILAAGLGSIVANMLGGTPFEATLFYTLGNLVAIACVTWLTRHTIGPKPDMEDLSHLGQFLLFGGLIGPFASACVAALAMRPSLTDMAQAASAWVLAESMGMILVVPAVLLVAEALRNRKPIVGREVTEFCLIIAHLC